MPGVASGLQRDIRLVRRRIWVFIPFLIIGIFIAVAFRSVAGNANAVASMTLETVIQDLVVGGDRGLRIFEAQSMTSDPAFKQKVIDATGDPNFDYSRFSIALAPISVADGVSRGILSVSIQDANKAEAERLRGVFVDVFTKEYTSEDGLFRSRFVNKKQEVADLTEKDYRAAVDKLTPIMAAKNLPLDEILRSQGGDTTTIGEINRQMAPLTAELAQVTAALAASGGPTGVQASAILGTTVADGAAQSALQGRSDVLKAAIAQLTQQRFAMSDISFDPATLAMIDSARILASQRSDAYVRLTNAQVAVTSAQSSIDISYSFSGGVAGTLTGRIAVALAFTVVFGLIAIYGWEWLTQVRAGSADPADSA
jgi:hypothetical protein